MELYSIYQKYPIICTDTRNIVPDSIFFALRGDNFDANAFARTALDGGCAYAVIDNPQYADDDRFILVNDVLTTLQNLARYHRQQTKTTVIAITGTNGKTTTKELIAAVLMQKYNIVYTQGNLNNHIGVPLTLLKIRPEHEFAIIEMGANHPKEIEALAAIAQPDYGLITNVGKAHLEGFGSFDGVKNTKGELYEFIAANGKAAFLNQKNEYLNEMAQKAKLNEKIIPYRAAKEITASPFLEMTCITNQELKVKTKLIGSYNAENVLAAVTLGNYFGVENSKIEQAIANYTPSNNRSQYIETEHNKLIVDAYNANPSSMTEAIRNFAQIKADKKMLILGDMLELGKQSADEHQSIIKLLEDSGLANVLLVGRNFFATKSRFPKFENTEDLLEFLEDNRIEKQYILLKASRGIHLEKIIGKL
ncbi:MAG: UDP-N-acetylmuramoyl-tripeptide--D-alanyl-D-alanine ligase [Paludibacter sp.]|nr:UDP-N-acetylmuramoyl-tripeptide--D-alanyl-D-alanine ligase [Paludibacter sp.]